MTPKWVYHRKVAKILSLSLSNYQMRSIDSFLDGIGGGGLSGHDFWREKISSLDDTLAQINTSYGADGVKYALIHVLLDTFKEELISELTGEKYADKEYADKLAFFSAMFRLRFIRDHCASERRIIINQLLSEIESKEEEIIRIIRGSPEVKTQVGGIERFKMGRKRAEEIARKYAESGFDIPFYACFILELWNDKRRGNMRKKEWGEKILAKYQSMTEGLNKEAAEKRRINLTNIARNLSYL
jgi:hypothetical protein